MSAVYLVAVIGGVALTAFAARASFFLLPESFELPARVERALRYAPACALTAIVAPAVLVRDHHPYIAWSNYRIWAVLAAAVVFLRWRNMMLTMAIGMAVFTALRLASG